MFEFIIGKIVSIKDDYAVIQNSGIGYKVYTSVNTMADLKIGEEDQILYTQLQVREDGIFLFGFSKEDEMSMFNLLLLVSKIGPKTAVGILSSMTPNKLKAAILNNDIAQLCKAPGIGKRTAERMVVELKDRIDKNSITDESEILSIGNNDYEEAVMAFTGLGYTRLEAEKVIRAMDIENMNLEGIIKEGLKRLSKH